MTPDLRHSVPNTAIPSSSVAQQIGIHIVSTAYCVDILNKKLNQFEFLPANTSSSIALWNLGKSLKFFKENATLIDVLLNREPIYLAAQVLGVDEADVDNAATQIWPLYQNMQITVSAFSDDNFVLYEALASHVAGDIHEQSVVRYEIILSGENASS